MLTKLELQGMEHGTFPMDKDAGIEACKAYRKALEEKGFKTYLKHCQNGLFHVEIRKED